jgi:hypothetical protein
LIPLSGENPGTKATAFARFSTISPSSPLFKRDTKTRFSTNTKKNRGGSDSYHPKMLTKVIIYAYTQRIYSSRQIAKAVREANVGKIENWTYDTAEDHWTCPAGNMLHFHR